MVLSVCELKGSLHQVHRAWASTWRWGFSGKNESNFSCSFWLLSGEDRRLISGNTMNEAGSMALVWYTCSHGEQTGKGLQRKLGFFLSDAKPSPYPKAQIPCCLVTSIMGMTLAVDFIMSLTTTKMHSNAFKHMYTTPSQFFFVLSKRVFLDHFDIFRVQKNLVAIYSWSLIVSIYLWMLLLRL